MINKTGIRVLEIDLSKQKIKIHNRTDLLASLGGVGIATKLLAENVVVEAEPLAAEQPIILAIGPMETIFPVVTKVVAMFRSPLTGELGESYAGLRLGLAMRYAGYDAIVIKGKAVHPTHLVISDNMVEFDNAEPLWGLTTEETGQILRRKASAASGLRSCIRIGPAGEKLIRFAGVNVDTYRHFGRLGLGAVFGSKLLKAIVIKGEKGQTIPNRKEYQQVYKEIYQRVVKTEVMDKYHAYGTAVNVLSLNGMNGLPTNNLQAGTFAEAAQISGEAFAKESLVRKMACSGCPIGCIHIAQLRRQFGEHADYYSTPISYDHELVFALGSFLGISDRDELLSLIELTELYGLDAITTGVLLGWITEAFANQLLTTEMLGCQPAFGQVEAYRTIIHQLVAADTEFYQDLAQGTEAAAQKYGGLDYAMCLGKNEIAGYHTGYANILGQAAGARHSHLDNAGYSVDQKLATWEPETIVQKLIEEEVERNILNCLCICLFARNVYDRPTVSAALKSLDLDWDEAKLGELGKEIFRQKRVIKDQLGFRMEDLRFPKRFFETQSLNGKLDADKMEELIQLYHKAYQAL